MKIALPFCPHMSYLFHNLRSFCLSYNSRSARRFWSRKHINSLYPFPLFSSICQRCTLAGNSGNRDEKLSFHGPVGSRSLHPHAPTNQNHRKTNREKVRTSTVRNLGVFILRGDYREDRRLTLKAHWTTEYCCRRPSTQHVITWPDPSPSLRFVLRMAPGCFPMRRTPWVPYSCV